MKKRQILLATLAVLGTVAIVVAVSRSSRQPQADHPRLAPGVAMQDVTFFSAALNRQMPYRVFLPEKLIPGQKLPVVYLLHGGGGSYRDWSNGTNVAGYAAPRAGSGGMILVMPDGGDTSCYMNSAEKPEDRFEDYLVHDLIADVEARFPAATGRENRAFAGVSMGGFAAVKLALSRPELFVFAGAISPAVNVTERPFRLSRVAQWWKLRSVFGPWNSQARRDDDPFLLVQSANPAATPYIYLTAGEQEILLEPNRRFAALLEERGFSHEFHTKPGGHDRDQWQSQLPGCFESLLVHLKPTH